MKDWTGGYITDVEYTAGFQWEVAPVAMNFAALSRGVAAPDPRLSYNWLDIGCGHGVTANVLAAANPQSRFYAFDFNPDHIRSAQALMKEAAIGNVSFFEDSFEQALLRDLPPMDYIVAHGIYSWVSRENREHVMALVRKLLKPGGMFYLSYNCLPGWGGAAPLRQLMIEYAARQEGSRFDRLGAACDFARALKQAGAEYFNQNPSAVRMVDSFAGADADAHYLIHEFMGGHWELSYHSDVAAHMNTAKLTFVASATLIDNLETSVAPPAAELLRNESDPVMRELLRDFTVNQRFRRDLYALDVRRYGDDECAARASALRLCLLVPREKCALNAKLSGLQADLPLEVYARILDALATGSKTVAELAVAANLPLAECTDAATRLCFVDYAHFMVDEPAAAAAESCRTYNAAVLRRTVAGEKPGVLAVPNLGTGIAMVFAEQLFLYAHMEGMADPVAFAWDRMKALNKRFQENGKRIEDEAGNLDRLRRFEAGFTSGLLPLYKTWGLVS